MRYMLTLLALAVATAALTTTGAFGGTAAQTVRVTETDYRITLSAKPRPGKVTFIIRNAADDEHDFWLRGGGVTKKTPLLAPGATARLTVTLKRGVRYQLWCAPHAGKGMRASFVAR